MVESGFSAMAINSTPGQPKRTGHARVVVTTASAAGLLMLLVGSHLAGRSSAVDTTNLYSILRTHLQFSNSELSALTQGRPVVKTLPPTMNREMTTAGAVRIRSDAMWRFVNQFKTLEGFKTSQFVLQVQKFSDPPQLSNLDSLIVDREDIESLRECRVGACDVQLAADDISRLRAEVNWRSPKAAEDAAALYKAILFAHLTRYRTGGNDQLVHYQDREAEVRLAAETAALLDAKPSLLDHAPALQDHIRQYPAGAAANVEDFFYWSKEVFGFKPVIGMNHVRVFTDGSTGNVMIVTTQIYASHYLEGSVAVSRLMPDRDQGNEPTFYWIYMNRTRVGRLAGLLGSMSRPIVQRRARSGLMKSLSQTKQRFEAAQ
jgi:hypothetical protein